MSSLSKIRKNCTPLCAVNFESKCTNLINEVEVRSRCKFRCKSKYAPDSAQGGAVLITSLMDVIDCAHLSPYVQSPFAQRGGIMIVGPPGAMKSTIIESGLHDWPNALVISDLNVKQLGGLRDDLTSNRYSTIAFTEFEKLYQRHGATATNLEGHIKALVEEGFTKLSWEPQSMPALKARSLVVGAMTYKFFSRNFEQWCDSGFARRFLWCLVRMKNPQRIVQAIHNWELIQINGIFRRSPGSTTIPYKVTPEESRQIMLMCKDQRGEATPYVLMKKILCVLKWKYAKEPKKPMMILTDFAKSLSKEGDEIEL